MLDYADMAAEVMEHLCDHAAHGYSQGARAGDGTVESILLSDGTQVQIHGGDYDCSEAVRMCYAAVGVLAWAYHDSYMWTGNELALLKASGFIEVDLDKPLRGDVLWRTGHTELYLGDGICAGARLDEHGGITGGTAGDQTGQEIARGTYTASKWTACLRYPRKRVVTHKQMGDEMICIIRPDKQDFLMYFDGQQAHMLEHPDEVRALDMVYQLTHDGASIPIFELGTKEAPWAWRLLNAISHPAPTV